MSLSWQTAHSYSALLLSLLSLPVLDALLLEEDVLPSLSEEDGICSGSTPSAAAHSEHSVQDGPGPPHTS